MRWHCAPLLSRSPALTGSSPLPQGASGTAWDESVRRKRHGERRRRLAGDPDALLSRNGNCVVFGVIVEKQTKSERKA